ncbi:MAG: sigma-70 family RNA polymerase sigma factor [Alloprevotella sp.]|nr:sigma-70 family RNA polymerase sigma factor [Alloprevotella sp.]
MTTSAGPSNSPLLAAYRRLSGRLRHLVGRMTQSDEEAEDALQEAFCRLWKRHPDIKREDEAAALLTTTVKHLAVDALRQRGKTCTDRLDALPEEADEQAERERLFDEVERLIDRHLSPTAREILHRHDYQGQDYATIASELHMQEAAVRMQLSRARKTIRQCYLNSMKS